MSNDATDSELCLALLVIARGILRLDGGRDRTSGSELKVEQTLEIARLLNVAASRLSKSKASVA